MTKKGLHILNRKLAAAASASTASRSAKGKKRAREDDDEQEEPAMKKPKVASVPVREVDASNSRGRIKTYSSNAKKAKRAVSRESSEDAEKRKRGRPRVSSPSRTLKAKVKVEEHVAEQDKSLFAQPRAVNGRFGKKSPKKVVDSKSQSSSSRKVPEDSDHEGDFNSRSTLRRKRSHDSLEDVEESPKKKIDSSDKEPEAFHTTQRIVPRPVSGFRGGRLFSNPNPQQFALYAWAGPLILDDSSSSDDEKHPETPEDDQSITASVVSAEDDPLPFFPLPTLLSKAPLSYKPSPHSFGAARHRNLWAQLQNRVEVPKLQIVDTEVNSYHLSLWC